MGDLTCFRLLIAEFFVQSLEMSGMRVSKKLVDFFRSARYTITKQRTDPICLQEVFPYAMV